MSDTLERTDTDVDLESMFNEDMQCQEMFEDCPRPVAYVAIKDLCGHQAYYCNYHILSWLLFNRTWDSKTNKPIARCKECNTDTPCTILPI